MGSSTPPHGYPQRHISTVYLRIPLIDWDPVRLGFKREFRTTSKEGSMLMSAITPCPVVAYASGQRGKKACKLMILEESRIESLIEIADNPESLKAKGFDTYDQFKAYWRNRHGAEYRAMQRVLVTRLRPWAERADIDLATSIVRRLYGDFMPPSDYSEYLDGNL